MHCKCNKFEMYPFRERTAGRDQKDAAQSAGGQGTGTGKTTVGIYEGYAIAYPVENVTLAWMESSVITFVKEHNGKLFARMKAGR